MAERRVKGVRLAAAGGEIVRKMYRIISRWSGTTAKNGGWASAPSVGLIRVVEHAMSQWASVRRMAMLYCPLSGQPLTRVVGFRTLGGAHSGCGAMQCRSGNQSAEWQCFLSVVRTTTNHDAWASSPTGGRAENGRALLSVVGIVGNSSQPFSHGRGRVDRAADCLCMLNAGRTKWSLLGDRRSTVRELL